MNGALYLMTRDNKTWKGHVIVQLNIFPNIDISVEGDWNDIVFYSSYWHLHVVDIFRFTNSKGFNLSKRLSIPYFNGLVWWSCGKLLFVLKPTDLQNPHIMGIFNLFQLFSVQSFVQSNCLLLQTKFTLSLDIDTISSPSRL